jgi:glycosyltransferase involved in cell wall biosynthesis
MILFVSRTGILEPLGKSQVLSYLKGLAKSYPITLVTFERSDLVEDQGVLERMSHECEENSIAWQPLLASRGTQLRALQETLKLVFICLRASQSGGAKLIHARSYLPAVAAWVVYRLVGTPFIFDMRALWLEELIETKRLKRDTAAHRFLMFLEKRCLIDSGQVVCLTKASERYILRKYQITGLAEKILVIPTCVDLERFVPRIVTKRGGSHPKIYSAMGSVLSGWFHTDWLRSLFLEISRRDPSATFEVVTMDDPGQVRELLNLGEKVDGQLRVFSTPWDKAQEVIQRASVSVMLYHGGLASLGRAPTRFGEALACGIPVVANSGVGDVEEIVRTFEVGVLLDGGGPEQASRLVDNLQNMLLDPQVSSRCRQAAVERFSLLRGVKMYSDMYARLIAT